MWLWLHMLVPESFARKNFCQPYISLFLRFFQVLFRFVPPRRYSISLENPVFCELYIILWFYKC